MAESTAFQAFKNEPVRSEELSKTYRTMGQYGCNGVHHVVSFTKLTLDDQGAVINGVDDGYEQLGLCDGSCANSTARLGDGFVYTYDVAKEYRDE